MGLVCGFAAANPPPLTRPYSSFNCTVLPGPSVHPESNKKSLNVGPKVPQGRCCNTPATGGLLQQTRAELAAICAFQQCFQGNIAGAFGAGG